MTSERYTHGHHESVLRSHRARTALNSAAYLLPHLSPGLRVLDVGCGPGTVTLDLAERVAPGTAIGIDSSAEVVEIARQEARDRGATGVSFEVGDAYHLPFAGASFDVVHAHQMLQHLADPVAALVEMRRVCRPDGIVAARDADYSSMAWFPEEPALEAWLGLYRAVAGANGGQPDAGRRLSTWAEAAGLTRIVAGASVWCFTSAEDRAWWAGLWADRVASSALGERAVELGLAGRADLEDLARGWRRWASAPTGWFTVVHGEILASP